jgi:nitronate monooxygenase
MGSVSGGRLAAAVSDAGGLGLIGGGYGDVQWMDAEVAVLKSITSRPWGIGLITWSINAAIVEAALRHRPHALMLSFGDPRPYAQAIRRSGCKLICQVQGLPQARLALEAGADLLVAQGTEAGGHGGQRATLPLVPAIVDMAGGVPVIAAGGIADGRGLAAALMLGAQGALIGTRFYASAESLGRESAKERIVAASGEETARTRVFDVVRRYPWPCLYTGRALVNQFMDRWEGLEGALATLPEPRRAAYAAAVRDGDAHTAMVWAGEAVDLIRTVESAGALVAQIGSEAEALLNRVSGYVR